jgi:hypothetical protein
MRSATVRRLCVLAVGMALTGCVSHPVGPARTLGKYTGKAATTAKSALSQVETVRLAVEVADRDDATSAYISVVVSEAEDALDGLSGTFQSIQPPGEAADHLRDELSGLLTDALDHTAAVRIAARRGTLRGLRQVAEPLDGDADALRRFLRAHET